jgi:hypothetical protein
MEEREATGALRAALRRVDAAERRAIRLSMV